MKRHFPHFISLLLAAVLLFTAVPLSAGAAAALPGDLDGDGTVTALDARTVLRASVDLETLTGQRAVQADADRDGAISALDARLVLRASVDLELLVSWTEIPENARAPYRSKDYNLLVLKSFVTSRGEHTALDAYHKLSFSFDNSVSEERRFHFVGVYFNEKNEPFFYLPDEDDLAAGTLSYRTLHFSPFGVAELSEDKLIDVWCERAAAQGVMRNIAEDEITPSLKSMVDDAMNSAGLGANQYGGAIVRYILSHDTRGEILTAAADGDMETLKTKVLNGAGEYILGKVLTGEDDKILTQSVGDHAAMVKDGIKKGNYAEATLEIVKNIEKNMFPAVNYASKFADLTVKLADIWADNSMNEAYEDYKKLGGPGITNDDWNTLYISMHGAANWLQGKGLSDRDLREKFAARFANEAKIQKEKANMKTLVAKWKDMNLLSTQYWGKSNGFSATPSMTERLNCLRRTRESLREMLTVNGKLQKGNSYGHLTDEDFLLDAVFYWITYGPKNRSKFYDWLKKEGLYRDSSGTVRKYAWVLVQTKIDKCEDDTEDYYKYYYGAKETSHSNTTSFGSGDGYQYASFTTTCTKPPSVINSGDKVVLTITAKLTGSKGNDLGFTASASVRRDKPDMPRLSAGSGHYVFRSTENSKVTTCKASSPSWWNTDVVKSSTLDVFHVFGEPADENAVEGANGNPRIGIYFQGCGSQTVWIYEWKQV